MRDLLGGRGSSVTIGRSGVVRPATGLRPTPSGVCRPGRGAARTPVGVRESHHRGWTPSGPRLRTLDAMPTGTATDEERQAIRRRARIDALIVVVVGFIEIFGTAM